MFRVRAMLGGVLAAGAVAGLVAGLEREPVVVPAAQSVPACPAAGAYVPPPPASVGTPAGVPLCPARGIVEIVAPGTVLDGLDLVGGIVVAAPDVVVRRSRITGDGTVPAGVTTVGPGTVRIEDTTLTGDFAEAALTGARWTAERVELTRVRADGARLGPGAILRNSRLHDFRTRPDRPIHAVTLAGAADVLVEGTEVLFGRGPGWGSAVLAAAADGPRAEQGAVVRGNELGGGDYTVRQDRGADGAALRLLGNRFHRDAATAPLRVRPAALVRDNVFVDGGELRP